MSFNFIPTYADFGASINPAFRNRTLHMLSEHFGYDFEELEDICLEYESVAVADKKTAPEGFMAFLLEAIECDLMIEAGNKK